MTQKLKLNERNFFSFSKWHLRKYGNVYVVEYYTEVLSLKINYAEHENIRQKLIMYIHEFKWS